MGRPSQGISCRVLQIRYRPLVVFPLLKMHCQLSRNLTRLTAIALLEPLTDAEMKLLPSTDRNPFVPEVLIQRMPKPITSRLGPIGPHTIPSRAQKMLPTSQCRTAFFYLCCVDPAARCD